MHDLITPLFIPAPPAPAAGRTDPLLPVRRSFGEDDFTPARPVRRVRSRAAGRRKRPLAAA